jgi:single-strand DNA-binding protein
MIVFGNIATPIEKRTAKSGKDYFTFRLAENNGKDENRSTTWYDVSAFISELDADLLSKGQFIKLTGRLDIQAFSRKDGTPGASATVLAFNVETVQRKQPEGGAPQSLAPRAPRPSAQAPAPRPASGFDDMDDDIPF